MRDETSHNSICILADFHSLFCWCLSNIVIAIIMPYNKAITLMLLQHGASAFQATYPSRVISYKPISNLKHQTNYRSVTSLQTASIETTPALESILDDGQGNMNSDLAQAIYEWEKSHSNAQLMKQQQFSTRDGLRLVDELAREILASLGSNDDATPPAGSSTRKSGVSYNDLIQEGLSALLRAMSTYDNYIAHTTASKISTFEKYAKSLIETSLLHFLATTSRPINVPLSLQTTLQTANAAAKRLRETLGKEPSLVQVAREVEIAPEQLALYRKLYRTMVSRVGTFVSVEDGMEVYDPTLAGVGVGTLRSRRDSDSGPDGGEGGGVDEDTVAAEEDLTQINSQEDDWTRAPPERVVAPLRDVLTDTEEINNPLSYTHHFLLNEELNEFLQETLTEEERTIIQLRFGLEDSKYGGKGWTTKDISERMGMDHKDVVKVASAALDKLRKEALINWDEHDPNVEVSL